MANIIDKLTGDGPDEEPRYSTEFDRDPQDSLTASARAVDPYQDLPDSEVTDPDDPNFVEPYTHATPVEAP